MGKVFEFEKRAEECRAMAANIRNPVHKRQLLEMAEAWDMLARERRKRIAKQDGIKVADGAAQPLNLIQPNK